MAHPIDPIRFKVLDPFLETVDILSDEDAAVIRMAIFNFIKPKLTPKIGEAIQRNGKNPPVIANNLVIRRMLGRMIADEGFSEPLLVQAVALVVRDQLRSYVDEVEEIRATQLAAGMQPGSNDYARSLKDLYDSCFGKFFTFESVLGMSAENE